MGSSKQSTTSTQSQSGTIAPWQPTTGGLNSLISGINSIMPNFSGNSGAMSGAFNQIMQNAQGLPDYSGQAKTLADNLASGGTDYRPMVSDAYSQYQKALTPILNGSLDPMQTPGLSDALGTIKSDTMNSVNGMFAGAGRDLSGLNQQYLARGLAQGEAPVIANQYNQNVNNRLNAGAGLLGGAQSAANTNSGLQQTMFGNQMYGVTNGANLVNGAANAGPLAMLNAGMGIPAQNLAQLEALLLPIAGLGKQYTGTASGQSNSTSTPSLMQNLGSLFSGGGNSTARGILSFL